jgi:hypothetical protein
MLAEGLSPIHDQRARPPQLVASFVVPSHSLAVRSWHFATFAASQHFGRYWHKADIEELPINVCFRGKSGHRDQSASCPLMTQSGHLRRGH